MKIKYPRSIPGLIIGVFLACTVRAEWIQIPLVTATQRANGSSGGEGCQVLESLNTDATGNILFASTDVGGLLRSRNAGVNWEPINAGFSPRGATYIAVDPLNANRVLAAGSNGANPAQPVNGMYLSTNQGDTWTSVLYDGNAITKPYRDLIAYDLTTYSSALGYTQTIYWSSPTAFYKSTDGGGTWAPVTSMFLSGTATSLANCTLKVDSNGVLYAGHSTGIYKSTDQGLNFSQVVATASALKGMDLVDTTKIYYNTASAVFAYDTATGVSTQMAATGLPLGKLAMVKVSPVNQNNLAIFAGDFNPICYSTNGGANWARSTYDNSKSFIPDNSNQQGHATAWHPTDANTIYGFSWGFLLKSVNAGQKYTWSNQGYTGVMHSGFFNFNVFDPNLLLITTQDYNSAFTTDGGTTWKYLNVANTGWGGYQYGGYALSSGASGRMYAGNSEYWNGPRTLRVSMNGGSTWTSLGLTGNTADAAIGDPTDPTVAFWDQYRTANGMATGTASDWTVMTNCSGVSTYDPVTKALYGRSGYNLVRSTDHGVTWNTVATMPEYVSDLAYDHVRDRIYIAATSRKIYMVDVGRSGVIEITGRLPADQRGNRGGLTVAVDPADPDVVYVGNRADLYMSSAAVVRSIDGAVTWSNLTKQPGQAGLDGGREPWNLRVHPTNGLLYVGTECFGTWAYTPPATQALSFEAENLTVADQSAAAAAPATLSAAANGQVMNLGTTGAGSYVTLALPGCAASTYNLAYVVRKTGNPGGSGVFQVAIADNAAGPFTNLGGTANYYDASPKLSVINLGEVSFATPGTKYLRFTCTGHNGGDGYNGKIDAVVLDTFVQKNAPAADAFVRDGTYQYNNYGSDVSLTVKKDLTDWNRNAYVRFSVAPSGPVQSAKLRLYGSHAAGTINPTVVVSSVANTTWSESTLTWAVKPAPGATLASLPITTTTGQYYEWDVTDYVQTQTNAGVRELSFCVSSITTASAEVVTFNSKEAAANPPELVVKAAW